MKRFISPSGMIKEKEKRFTECYGIRASVRTNVRLARLGEVIFLVVWTYKSALLVLKIKQAVAMGQVIRLLVLSIKGTILTYVDRHSKCTF